MSEQALRQNIIDQVPGDERHGAESGTSGNLSMRFKDGRLITPSGAYKQLVTEDIVFLKMDGTVINTLMPSSECMISSRYHMARPEVNAVVHAYPTPLSGRRSRFAVWICPAVHYMIAVSGAIPSAALPITLLVRRRCQMQRSEALQGRTACLLANHGMIATGPDLTRAMWLAVEVETLAAQYFHVLQLGEPVILSDAEIARVLEKFKTYGMQSSPSAAAKRSRSSEQD